MFGTVNSFFPSIGSTTASGGAFHPPPPPPPRKGALEQCAVQEAPVGSGRSHHDRGDRAIRLNSKPAKSSNQQHSNKTCSCCCKQLTNIEGRLLRMESETQASIKALSADLARVVRERETAWKHVGELQEQNRLMRQRQRDLEEQNSILNRLLHERNERRAAAVAPHLPSDGVQHRTPLLALTLNQQTAVVTGMPKVPHMGTEIW